jgi:hypothetical protein
VHYETEINTVYDPEDKTSKEPLLKIETKLFGSNYQNINICKDSTETSQEFKLIKKLLIKP